MYTNSADDVVNTILVDVDNATTVTILRAHVRLTLYPDAVGLFAIEWVPNMMPRPHQYVGFPEHHGEPSGKCKG